MTSDDFANESDFELKTRIIQKTARIGVLGLGHAGLPVLLAASKSGFCATGFDINEGKIQEVNEGLTASLTVSAEEVTKLIRGGFLRAPSEWSELQSMDIMLVCVPTPITNSFEPDLSFVHSALTSIRKYLRPGQLIVLESTTYPGTTSEIVERDLSKSGLKCDEEFFVAYSPVREDPGNDQFSVSNIPRIVGADYKRSEYLATLFYEQIVESVVTVKNTKTAEAAKLLENVFRSVNIALVNEMKVAFDSMDLDMWEVIDAAATKPFGFMPFYPGPGAGGHCIPIDPHYLTWIAKISGTRLKLTELACEINGKVPVQLAQSVMTILKSKTQRNIAEQRLLFLGVSYKKNISDVRESPAVRIISELEKHGANCDFYDPFVEKFSVSTTDGVVKSMIRQRWSKHIAASYDAVVITTAHESVDYESIVQHGNMIFDTRNVCARKGIDLCKVIKI